MLIVRGIYLQNLGLPQFPIIITLIARKVLPNNDLSGAASISGTTGNTSAQGPYLVRLFERKTGRLVRETWSDEQGFWQFDGLAAGRTWFVVMHDHAGDVRNPAFMNAAIQDMVST